jgi:hypothetical protein
MSIINSSTTGHSALQEKKFSKKLFIGLIIAIAFLFTVFVFTSQTQSMKVFNE